MAGRKSGLKYAASGGEASLMVWNPAPELVKEVGPAFCFLLPIMQRQGGILAAIPLGFLSEEVLIDAAEEGNDGVVGPSKDFEAALVEEDEAGQIVESGYSKAFVVVDLTDACLANLKDYDPVTDTDVFPFEETMPAALPRVADIVQNVMEWIEATSLSRVNFYSAREEQAVPAAPKRAAPKKVSNAALVEQLSNDWGTTEAFVPVCDSGWCFALCRSCSRSRSWRHTGEQTASCFKWSWDSSKYPQESSRSFGSPSKNEDGRDSNSSTSEAEGGRAKGDCGGGDRGDHAGSPCQPIFGHHGSGGSSDKWRRRNARSFFFRRSAPGLIFSRSRSEGENAVGIGKQEFQLLLGSATTIVPQDESCQGGSQNSGGSECRRRFHDCISGALWGLQKCQRCRSQLVGCCPRHGLCCRGRLCWYSRVPGAALCRSGTKRLGRVMVFGLGSHVAGRSSGDAVCRPDATGGVPWTALCAAGSSYVGGDLIGLPEGDRGFGHQEDRGQDFQIFNSKVIHGQRRGGQKPLPEKTAKVPKDSKGGPSKGAMKNKSADACKGCGVGGTFDIDGERVVPGPSPSLRCGTPSPMARTTNSLPKCRTGSQTLSYPKWCALLVSNVLKTRTSFASFLNKSIFLSQAKSRLGMAPTFFPIPVPPGEHFDRMPASTSQHKRRMVHLKRAIHTICMAMNFWYGGGKFSDMELLQREPNNQHRCFYGRLAALIRSDGLAESFTVAKSGRRFPNLIARLSELSTVLTKQGGFDPYSKTFAGADVELDEEAVNSLNPYRDLDPSRLVLHGTGTWDATSFLSDDLVMAYREPRVLLSGIDAGVRPAIRDAVATVGELAKRWDKNGLLLVHDEPVNPDSFVKIFNCFKSAALDRQIGDRRGQNSLESRLEGPSRDLPSGSDMQDIVANPKKLTSYVCPSRIDVTFTTNWRLLGAEQFQIQ